MDHRDLKVLKEFRGLRVQRVHKAQLEHRVLLDRKVFKVL
jgi:hypothetical protein